MSEKKLFQVFINKLEFDPCDYLVSAEEHDLSSFQKGQIESATAIMKDNILGDVKSFGGNVKVNEEKFKELETKANEELQNEEYEDKKKELKNYIKKLKELIEKTCIAIIPVKELPWVNVLFRTVPRIVFDKKVELLDNVIAFYGEIKCVISRPTIFGKMVNEKPLFAPIMGTVDLGEYKLDESQKGPKSQVHTYVSAIINSFDSLITRNHLVKYHESYQRHGDPICDFLMKDNELMSSMEKITSSIETGRDPSEIAVVSMAVPQSVDKTTLLVVVDEGKDPNQFSKCFEALLRFSAECCNVPSTGVTSQQPQMMEQQPTQESGTVRTSGGQELKVWTAEELAEQAQQRMQSQPEMPEWTEEELNNLREERGSGIPEGMEVWTEEELQELARKRQGGLDIPEWEPDKDMKECVKCGYSLRPGWSRCPICETPVDAKVETEEISAEDRETSEKSTPEPIPEPSEESQEEPSDKLNDEPSEDNED